MRSESTISFAKHNETLHERGAVEQGDEADEARSTSELRSLSPVFVESNGMTMRRIYIETTIPSFYYEVRVEPEMVARRNWTREWFDAASGSEEFVTSTAVLLELERGTFPGRSDVVKLISNLPPLAVTKDVEQIVEEYISRLLMPSDPSGDALHLALASFYECEFLVTWNCKHLANANKFDNIARINDILGLAIPKIVTPLELLEYDDE